MVDRLIDKQKSNPVKTPRGLDKMKTPLIIAGAVIGLAGLIRGTKELCDDNDFSWGGMTISDDYGLWGEAKFEYNKWRDDEPTYFENGSKHYTWHEIWTLSYDNICLVDNNNDAVVDQIEIDGHEYLPNDDNKDIFSKANKRFAEYCEMLNCNQIFREWEMVYRPNMSRQSDRNYVLRQLDR